MSPPHSSIPRKAGGQKDLGISFSVYFFPEFWTKILAFVTGKPLLT
jgi:hypothetical protein